MQVIGLCRFSYPALGGFQVEHASVNDRRAYLYDPARLAERLAYFETICLPGLRAQSDPDFVFLILIGDDLPEAVAAQLFDLTADMPQVQIVPRLPGKHRAVCQQVINAARQPGRDSLQFRLDDDDTVARDFVARLRGDAGLIAPLRAAHRMVAMDYNRGFLLRPGPKGIAAEPCVMPYHSMGLAVAVRAGCDLTVMNFGHSKLHHHMPTVTFTDSPMYLRGHSDRNDSRQKKHVKPVHLPAADAQTLALLQDRFGVSEDHVRRRFA